ncbi:DHA2 family efflux MFS transporter permease subunit [Virgisporangium ochraceum]
MTTRQGRTALAVLASATLMIILDGSIVTVAMPAIQADLGFSDAGLSWVVNAYLVAFGSLLLLAGRLGDLLGRRTLFLAGTAVFTAASALAGVATSGPVMLAALFLQCVGSAMAVAVSLGILVMMFTEPGERGRAIAVFSFTGAAGASIGQVLGGVLTDALSWHWIFVINVPIGLAVLAAATRVLPDDPGLGLRTGADVIGAALVTAGLVVGLVGVVGGNTWALAGSVALIAAFVARQATAKTPLVPLRIFRSRTVSGANVVQILMVAACFAFQILLALYLQKVQHYGAAGTGLAMLPAAVVIGAVSLGMSARLIARFGERPVLVTGLALLLLLFLALSRLPVDASYPRHLLPVLLLTSGFGLALPALTALGMSGARPDDAGLASGLFNTTQQLGMALGAATLATLAAARTDSVASGADSAGSVVNIAAALTAGYRLAFTVAAVLVLVALVAGVTVLRPRIGGDGHRTRRVRAADAHKPREEWAGCASR